MKPIRLKSIVCKELRVRLDDILPILPLRVPFSLFFPHAILELQWPDVARRLRAGVDHAASTH